MFLYIKTRFYGVTVSTLDFESSNPSSNLGRTSFLNMISLTKKNISFLKSIESLQFTN
jgi:hypothetical protein